MVEMKIKTWWQAVRSSSFELQNVSIIFNINNASQK